MVRDLQGAPLSRCLYAAQHVLYPLSPRTFELLSCCSPIVAFLQLVVDSLVINSLWVSHLFTFQLNSVPKVTIAHSPRDTVAQSRRDTVAQSARDTVAQSPRDTVAQSTRDTVAQTPRDTKSETPRSRLLFFLGNLLSCPPTSRLRPRFLLLVRVVHQRVVPVGGPNVTAASPYPALRLDKLYAALIRCLVLWIVTKQVLVSCFKGLYFLLDGSDVTRGISCDSSLH